MQTISLRDIQNQIATLERAERFFESAVLFALFEVGALETLSDGPKTFEQLRDQLDGNSESLRAALDAAVALKLLSKRDGRYAAPEEILESLGRRSSRAYFGEWVSFLHALAMPLLRLGEEIREGSKPGALFEANGGDNFSAKRMTEAMDAYARTRGIEVVDRLDLSDTRRLLDLGCGPGTYSLAIMERWPQVRATLLDLPGPITEARRLVTARGMSARVEFVTGDALRYTPQEPFDTVLVSNTLHMIGPEVSQALLKHCRDMIHPGGRIIVQAQFLNDDRVSPRWATLLNLIQRVATPSGRNHAFGETTQWLREAGFIDVSFLPLSVWNVNSCLIGRRPKES